MPRSYVTNLRKGRIENPGYEKMRTIAKAMGFAPEVWFEEALGDGRPRGRAEEYGDVVGRLEHLLDAIRNPKTGETHTNAEVARMTLGDLSEEEVEGIRSGAVSDPTVSQVAALPGVFDVEASYLLDRGEPSFDDELVEALQDKTVWEVTRDISHLSERERQLVLGILRHFENPGEPPSG